MNAWIVPRSFESVWICTTDLSSKPSPHSKLNRTLDLRPIDFLTEDEFKQYDAQLRQNGSRQWNCWQRGRRGRSMGIW